MNNSARRPNRTWFGGISLLVLTAAIAFAAPAKADIIKINYDYVEAGAIIDAYLGSTHYYWGSAGGDGLLRLASSNPVGSTASLLKPALWGYCMEIDQYTSCNSNVYNVNSLASVLGDDKALLIQQVWAENFDYAARTDTPVFYGGPTGFTSGEPADNAENLNAIAMAYAIFEIRYDYNGSLSSLDLTSGQFRIGPNQTSFSAATVQAAAQAMLDGLVDPQDYTGYRPELVALTNESYQNLITEIQPGVPEPATMGLLGFGGLALLGRKRR